MRSSQMKDARFGLALLGAVMIAHGPAHGQPTTPPGPAYGSSAADALSWNLRSLSENPRNLTALVGAGKAALKLGDPQAAITFFARAEEISPSDGAIKMWIGSALVQLEQPRAALKFFGDAITLGALESEVARDRGLAFDISGESRRAQRDYELALRRGPDPEVTRRLALSLAISGERERALQLLEDQLLVRDPAAFRTRAFVLALTGDVAGASRATEAAMSGQQAAAMAPFLGRLASLSPGDRALAVNFGHFPGDGRPQIPQSFASIVSATNAGRPDPAQSALGTPRSTLPEPVSTAPRRRPGTQSAPVVIASRSSPPAAVRQAPGSSPTAGTNGSDARPSGAQPAPVTAPELDSLTADASRDAAKPSAAAPVPAPAAGTGRLAGVAALVFSLPDNEPARVEATPPSRLASTVRTQTTASPAVSRPSAARTAAPAKAKKEPAKPAEPSRHWVQVAGGANKQALPREFARLKAKAPKLLAARSAWTTPLNATNRLLVGPFASPKEAQAFVNELGKLDMSGFVWTSPAGQRIEKLPAK